MQPPYRLHPSHDTPRTRILFGIKKACGDEAIGETVAQLNRYTIILLAVAKVRRKNETAKKKGKNFRIWWKIVIFAVDLVIYNKVWKKEMAWRRASGCSI